MEPLSKEQLFAPNKILQNNNPLNRNNAPFENGNLNQQSASGNAREERLRRRAQERQMKISGGEAQSNDQRMPFVGSQSPVKQSVPPQPTIAPQGQQGTAFLFQDSAFKNAPNIHTGKERETDGFSKRASAYEEKRRRFLEKQMNHSTDAQPPPPSIRPLNLTTSQLFGGSDEGSNAPRLSSPPRMMAPRVNSPYMNPRKSSPPPTFPQKHSPTNPRVMSKTTADGPELPPRLTIPDAYREEVFSPERQVSNLQTKLPLNVLQPISTSMNPHRPQNAGGIHSPPQNMSNHLQSQSANLYQSKEEYGLELQRQMKERRDRENAMKQAVTSSFPRQQNDYYYNAPMDPEERKRVYAMELERQIMEKRARESELSRQGQSNRTRSPERPPMNDQHRHHMQLPQDHPASKQAYAEILKQQMIEKQNRDSLQRDQLNSRVPLDLKPHRPYPSNDLDAAAKQHIYAMELEKQIREKKEREFEEKNGQRREDILKSMAQSLSGGGFYASPTLEKVQKQQEYAQALERQMAFKQSQLGGKAPRSPYSPMNNMAPRSPYNQMNNIHNTMHRHELSGGYGLSEHDRERQDKVFRQQQYARELQQQMESRNIGREGHRHQKMSPTYYYKQRPPSHIGVDHNAPLQNGGRMSEKDEKRLKQQQYKHDLEMQEMQRKQQKALEKAQDRYYDMEVMRQQADLAKYGTGAGAILPGSPNRHNHRPNQDGEAYQNEVFGHPSIYPQMQQHRQEGFQTSQLSPGFNPVPGQGFRPGMEPMLSPMGTPGVGQGFGRFRVDISDPEVRNELAEKKMKQLQRQQDLNMQIMMTQERKKQEKERLAALEREEEERVERERKEIQDAYEKEKAEKERKKQQQHQEELKHQIEEKKKQKEAEQMRLKQEEAEEEQRLQREREELENRFNASRLGGRNGALSSRSGSHEVKPNLKAGLFDSPNGVSKDLPGTAGLFGGSPTGGDKPESPPPFAFKKSSSFPQHVQSPPRPPQGTFSNEDVISKLLRETEAAKEEQVKTRAALESVQAALESISFQKPEQRSQPTNFLKDVLCYPFDPEAANETHGGFLFSPSPFKSAAQRMMVPTRSSVPPPRPAQIDNSLVNDKREKYEEFDSIDQARLKYGMRWQNGTTSDNKFGRSSLNEPEALESPASPTMDLVSSIYPGEKFQNMGSGNLKPEKEMMQGSLRSESKFILPNGQILHQRSKGSFPPQMHDSENSATLLNQMSPVRESPSPPKERGSKLRILDGDSPLRLSRQKNSTFEVSPKKTTSTPEKEIKLDEVPPEMLRERKGPTDENKSVMKEVKKEVKRELVLSPNFDIHRMHDTNKRRLEQLESFGDCSKLRGEQLDAFLEEFLMKSESDPCVVKKETERSLDCETRWISKRG